MPILRKAKIYITNPDLNPTFLKDTPVVLNKDYTQLYSKYFKKYAIATVNICGLSQYGFDPEKRDYTTLVDNGEWCHIELSGVDFMDAEGSVRATDLTDLRTLSDTDFWNLPDPALSDSDEEF